MNEGDHHRHPQRHSCRLSEPCPAPKPRHNLYLDDELTASLEALAAKPGTTKAAIIVGGAASYLDKRGADDLDASVANRLDRLGGQLDRIERDLQIVVRKPGALRPLSAHW